MEQSSSLKCSKLKCFNCQDPNIVREFPIKQECYNCRRIGLDITKMTCPPYVTNIQCEASCLGYGREHLVLDCPKRKRKSKSVQVYDQLFPHQ